MFKFNKNTPYCGGDPMTTVSNHISNTQQNDKNASVDVAASMNEYLSRSDWRVSANANQGYSLGGLILNVSGKVTANYWLNEIYPI